MLSDRGRKWWEIQQGLAASKGEGSECTVSVPVPVPPGVMLGESELQAWVSLVGAVGSLSYGMLAAMSDGQEPSESVVVDSGMTCLEELWGWVEFAIEMTQSALSKELEKGVPQ